MVGEHRVLSHGDKTAVPALCPAEWPEDANRNKATVRRVWFAAMDYDKLTKAEMNATLEAADGLAAVLYTTWSHAQRHAATGSWSFRLLVALSRPVEKAEWKTFWPRLNARLGGLADSRCKDPSRIYFLPSAPTAKGCIVEHSEGASLDVEAILGQEEPAPTREELQAVGVSDLEDFSARLVRRRSPTAKAVGRSIREALAKRPFAAYGDRDNALFRIACLLAEEWPWGDPAAMAAVFAPSLEEMAKIAPNCPTVENLADKISRKQEQVREEHRAQEKEREDALARRILAAYKDRRSDPYTEDELDSFAAAAGTDRRGFMGRWVVQADNSYYVFFDGSYGPPLVREGVVSWAAEHLAPAHSAGITVWRVTERGELRPKTPQELVLEYGTTAADVAADLNAQRSYFEISTKTLVEAPCPLRGLQPSPDPDVHAWLTALGGAQVDILLDWVACVTALDEPCAAVYLDGEPGSGKTLFADALARLWTKDGPTPLTDVVGSFNEHLTHCPLILADEVLPDILKRTDGTGGLRQLIQARQHVLRRKFLSNAGVRGAVRIILTANNKHLLDTNELLTPDDTAAVAERILYVHAARKAREVLEDLGYEKVRAFVKEDLVAKHALWLRDTRKVVRKHRFLVSGTDSALHRSLTTSRGLPSAICHWCVAYLLSPGKMDTSKQLLVRVHAGVLLITARALAESWEQYPTNVLPPPSGRISRALAGLSGAKKQMVAGNGKPTNYWPIKTSNLLTWAEEMGYCTPEELEGALGTDTPVGGGR